jgi:hypothetical protein
MASFHVLFSSTVHSDHRDFFHYFFTLVINNYLSINVFEGSFINQFFFVFHDYIYLDPSSLK